MQHLAFFGLFPLSGTIWYGSSLSGLRFHCLKHGCLNSPGHRPPKTECEHPWTKGYLFGRCSIRQKVSVNIILARRNVKVKLSGVRPALQPPICYHLQKNYTQHAFSLYLKTKQSKSSSYKGIASLLKT